MKYNRRSFMWYAGIAAATPLLFGSLASCNDSTESNTENNATETETTDMTSSGDITKYGIQLFTVRDYMTKDPKGTLKALAGYGYDQIESFQGDQGVFWGMSAKDFRTFMNDIGTTIVSTHCDPQYTMDIKKEDEFKKLADDAVSINMKYLVNPYLGFLKTLDEFKQATDGFNRQAEICKAAGIGFAYHNHSYSFEQIDGQYPQDVMMQGTDPGMVDFEMDVYWVVTADEDPVKWLKKYPNRFKLSHVKDRYKAAKVAEIKKAEGEDPNFGVSASCVLGRGQIDFPTVLKAAKENGMEYFIVEQERYDDMSSMDAAQLDAEYMEKFEFA